MMYYTVRSIGNRVIGRAYALKATDYRGKEIIIPAAEVDFASNASVVSCSLEQVVGYLPGKSKVLRCMILSDSASILAEVHIHHPVQLVLHIPMASDGTRYARNRFEA